MIVADTAPVGRCRAEASAAVARAAAPVSAIRARARALRPAAMPAVDAEAGGTSSSGACAFLASAAAAAMLALWPAFARTTRGALTKSASAALAATTPGEPVNTAMRVPCARVTGRSGRLPPWPAIAAHDPAAAATSTATRAPAPIVARSGTPLRVVQSIGFLPREIHSPSARAGLDPSRGKRVGVLLQNQFHRRIKKAPRAM